MSSIYLIGSLRNPKIGEIANKLRAAGHDVFDDWFSAGPEADDYWQKYEQARSHNYKEGLAGYAAKHVYSFDKHHLDRCDIAVLAVPAGKSGHLELGYVIGTGKPGYILFADDMPAAGPDRWDVMYQFAKDVFFTVDELITALKVEETTEEIKATQPFIMR